MTIMLRPARAVSPGRILKKELEARGWDQKDLAEIMGRPAQAINEIISGAKRVTPETALELAQALGTSAELWTNLESSYRLQLAQKAGSTDEIARRSRLYGLAPINEMLKRGWIKGDPKSDIGACEKALQAFLGIVSLDESPRLAVRFRHSQERGPEATSLVSWVKRVEFLARSLPAKPFDKKRLVSELEDLLALSATIEGVSEVPAWLHERGVRFVMVPSLPKCYVDGAMFYLPDGAPVVALSLRQGRIDCFWFTLMHELAHILLGHAGGHVDNLEEGDLNVEEREANEQARRWLIDSTAFAAFIGRGGPHFSRNAIERFAQELGRHPGIVLGQLQFGSHVSYSHLRPLLVNVRPLLGNHIDMVAS
jgi:HTH-type transcriptional regulator/antitoxin HigA